MQLLFIVLEKQQHLRPVLKELLELGATGATVLPSTGTVRGHVPIFGGLRRALDGDTVRNTTVFSVFEDEDHVEQALAAVSRLVEGYFMFAVPVTRLIDAREQLPPGLDQS